MSINLRPAARLLRPAIPRELWRRNLVVVLLAATANWIGFDLINPFLPLYVLELGVENFAEAARWSGLLLGITPLLTAFFAPVWGSLADRHGRKRMAVLILASFTVGLAAMYVVADVQQLLVVRTILGFLGGFTTLTMVLATGGVPREHLGLAVGGLQSVQFVALAVVPPLGGVLVDHFGVRANCLAAAVAAAIGLSLIAIGYRQPPAPTEAPTSQTRRPTGFSSWPEMLRQPGFLTTMVILFGTTFVDRSFVTVVPLFVHQLAEPSAAIGAPTGLIIGLGALATALSANLYGRFSRVRSPDLLLGLSLSAGLLLVLPVMAVQEVPHLAVLRVLLALLAGGSATLAYTRAGRELPPDRSATGFSLLVSGAMLGAAASPILVGLLASLDLRAVFLVNAALYALALTAMLPGLRGWRRGLTSR